MNIMHKKNLNAALFMHLIGKSHCIVHFFIIMLLKLGEHSVTVFGVEEYDGFTMRPDLGVFSDSTNSTLTQVGDCLINVAHFYTDVVHAACLVLIQEVLYGTVLPVRMQQLDLRVSQLDKHRVHAVIWLCMLLTHFGPEDVSVEGRGFVHVGHCDGDVVHLAHKPLFFAAHGGGCAETARMNWMKNSYG